MASPFLLPHFTSYGVGYRLQHGVWRQKCCRLRAESFRSWARSITKQEPMGERILKMVATATSAPLAQYLSSPMTVLHSLDPRVKQIWLLALVVLPSRAHISIQLGTVLLLVALTISTLPERAWKDQLGRMAWLSGVLFIMLALGTDGAPPMVQTRTPPPALESLPALPPAFSGYSYVLFSFGPLQLTRKGLLLATAASCLSFTVLQSASLCLATTTPEQMVAGLRWYLKPLSRLGIAVNEITLTLLLSLRFVGLVFDEVRNLALAVVARGVQWKSLKLVETLDIYASLIGRLFKNLFTHAERITEAMVARGFGGDSEKHRLYFLTKLSINSSDVFALLALASLVVAVTLSEVVLQ